MRQKWLRVGCFLTGYNYEMIIRSSELSMKRVIRYTSALLIICLLWAFIGYAFSARYLKLEWYSCILGAVMMVLVAIQIERQIILSTKGNGPLHVARVIIALAMALIGTVIIDQIIFKDDIDKRKMFTIDEEVKNIFPKKSWELKRQIHEVDSIVLAKENERKILQDDVNKNPNIYNYETITIIDSLGNKTVTVIRKSQPNPKINQLSALEKTITDLRTERAKKDEMLLELRSTIEKDLKSNAGFLDELDVMYSLLSESKLSLSAWMIWFIFLLGLELFILLSKRGETETDYDKMMQQQMELHLRRIELLGRGTNESNKITQ